jgi:G3E family GTPase
MSVITPVSILTGFLGSGKTTLLNRLLQSPDLRDTAVLINEYGEIAIDHLLVRESSDNITVLANGCVCCSVAGDMVKALRDLYFKRANHEVPNFQRVIIETTGLADPAPIMHTLIEMPLVAARYALSGIITTIDATHGAAQLDTQAESVKQAAVADRIVITKTDIASLKTIAALRERLLRLNPGATIIESTMGNVDAAKLFDTGLYQPNEQPNQKTPDVANWLRAESYRPVLSTSLPRSKQSTPKQKHDERIASFCVRYAEPIVWDELINVIEMIQSMRGDQLLRMKGIVNVANDAVGNIGESKPRVIHAVQHTIYPAATLDAWPDNDHTTRLVFIVKDLDPAFIDECLKTYIQQGVSGKNASNAAPVLIY